MWIWALKLLPLISSAVPVIWDLFKGGKKRSKTKRIPVVGDENKDGIFNGTDVLIRNERERKAFREKWLSKIKKTFRRI